MKLKKSGFTLVELIAVIAVLALVISLSSGIFINVRKIILNKEYNNLVTYLETKAVEYANKTNYMSVSVEKLIAEGFVDPDDEEAIYNPENGENMNCYIININLDNGKYSAKLDKNLGTSNGKCKSYENISNYNICKINSDGTCSLITSDKWYNENIKLGVVKTGENTPIKSATFNWISSNGLNGSNYFIETNTKITSTNTYRVNIKENNIESDVTRVIKIDLEAPSVTSVTFESGWKAVKNLEIIATDNMGSGIDGYSLVKENEGCNKYQSDNHFEVTLSGNYKYCVKDKAGNVTSNVITISEIDNVKPDIPTIKASDNLTQDKWHTNNFTLTFTSDISKNKSRVIYRFGTKPSNLVFTGSSLGINSEYNRETIYVIACNEAGLCSDVAKYKVLFDNTPPKYSTGGSLGKGTISAPSYTDNASGVSKVYTCVSTNTVTSTSDPCFSTATSYTYSCGKTFKLYSYAVDAAGNVSAIYDHFSSSGVKYYKSCTYRPSGGTSSGGSSSKPSGGSSSSGSSSSSKPSGGSSSSGSSSKPSGSSSSSKPSGSSSSSKPSSGSSSSSSSSSNKLPTCYGTACGSYDKLPSSGKGC